MCCGIYELFQFSDLVGRYLCRISLNTTYLASINQNLNSSICFGQIYNFHRKNLFPPGLDRLKGRSFIIRARPYRLINNKFFIGIDGICKRSVPESKVSAVLLPTHDEAGHHAAGLTMRKLKIYYWLWLARETFDYILGCL